MTAKAKAKAKAKTVEEQPVTGFSKSRVLASQKYIANRDVLDVLLEDGKMYTDDDVQGILDDFLHKEIH